MSPRKKTRFNTPYFNCVLQENEKYHQVYSFSSSQYDSVKKLVDDRVPIKFLPAKRKQSHLKKFDEEMEFPAQISPIKKLDFEYKPMQRNDADAEHKSIAEVLQLPSSEKVSIKVYCNIENRPEVEVQLDYRPTPLMKKEILVNDDTGFVKVALWDNLIKEVPANGTYIIKNAIVKEYKQIVSLTTSQRTKIEVSVDNIEPYKDIPADFKLFEHKMPPNSLLNLSKTYFCDECKKFCNNLTKKPGLFICHICHASFSTLDVVGTQKKIECNWNAKLKFKNDMGFEIVTLTGPQMKAYLKYCNSNDDDDVTMTILKDDKTILICDSRGYCIGLK